VNCVAKDVLELSPSVYTFRVTVIQDSLYTAVRLPWVGFYSNVVAVINDLQGFLLSGRDYGRCWQRKPAYTMDILAL
jgi:hypothetical protein